MGSFATDYSGMKLPPRFIIVLVVCLIAIVLPAAPVQANGAYITLSPSSGIPGDTIKVYGNNFTAREWVDIYYYLDTAEWTRDEVQADGAGAFTFTLTIPRSYKGGHAVRAEDTSGKSASTNFNVKPGLMVSPQAGTVGTTAKVEGVGFAKDEEGIELLYYVNGNYETVAENIKADEDGSWERSIQIPSSAKGSHKIDAQGDASTLGQVKDATFTVRAGISLSTLSGSVGKSITMTGNGFVANDRDIAILFAGKEVSKETRVDADAKGHWEKVFKVPEMPKGTYTLTAEGEWTQGVTALSFKIEPGLTLSPSGGHVGTNVTVTGGGFAANKGVDIMYDGSLVETTGTNSAGSFEVTFTVPESQHGGRHVAAEVDGEVETTAIFTMESEAPDPPELISPADGSRVGLIGRVTPTFEWSEVPDESGVRYSLQIAASDNVTAAGEFAEPILSIADIVGTNYTLNATDALPYGTYYWIVQAVDRAENESNWTEPISLRVGLLPLWAFIVIIAAIVALIGTLLYFFVIRKRIYYY